MRLRAAAAALAIAAVVLPATATGADAAPVLRFSRVQYDSPGADSGSNTSLNAEYVRLTNYSRTATYRLTGWTVRDKQNHVYRFPTFALRPGRTVTLHTGRGSNTSTDLYWNSRYYIWNNTGDAASVRTSAGALDDSCSWGSRPGYTSC